ncbi:hypothetical protein [Caballeronia zhejiangensis]|uniref:hypothetical protein n=1 Tax=Caballeronia zhejiangensis TaxID=871203 RepID=UPI001F526AB0|nr:hypothetical protein [Caballeronia zhejiangensis]
MEHLLFLFRRATSEGWSGERYDNRDRELFMVKIVNPLLNDDHLDPRAMQPPRSHLRNDLLLEYVKFSCAWAITADRASEAGEEHKGWLCLCRAQYWLGRANQIADLPAKIKQVAAKRSTAGGKAKAAKRKVLEDYARSLALKGSYTSQSHAAMRIVARVTEHAKEIGDPWNPKDPIRSVERMLEGLVLRPASKNGR